MTIIFWVNGRFNDVLSNILYTRVIKIMNVMHQKTYGGKIVYMQKSEMID